MKRILSSKELTLGYLEKLDGMYQVSLVAERQTSQAAELLPHGRLIEIADSYTLIPEDQPGELARAIRQFVRDTPRVQV